MKINSKCVSNVRIDIRNCDCSWVCELSSIRVVEHSLPVWWEAQVCSCSASVAAIATDVRRPTYSFVTIRIKPVDIKQIDVGCSVCKPPGAIVPSYSCSVPLGALQRKQANIEALRVLFPKKVPASKVFQNFVQNFTTNAKNFRLKSSLFSPFLFAVFECF